MAKREPAAEQLRNFKESAKETGNLVTGYGVPTHNHLASLTVGPQGPLLIQDSDFIDEITHFDCERIPERVVHAKGAGKYNSQIVNERLDISSALKILRNTRKRVFFLKLVNEPRYDSGNENNFEQPRVFWKNVLREDERIRLVENIVSTLKNAVDFIQERAVKNFSMGDADFTG